MKYGFSKRKLNLTVKTIVGLTTLEFRQTALEQSVMLDCGFQRWSQKSESSAVPGLIEAWFLTIKRMLRAKRF